MHLARLNVTRWAAAAFSRSEIERVRVHQPLTFVINTRRPQLTFYIDVLTRQTRPLAEQTAQCKLHTAICTPFLTFFRYHYLKYLGYICFHCKIPTPDYLFVIRCCQISFKINWALVWHPTATIALQFSTRHNDGAAKTWHLRDEKNNNRLFNIVVKRIGLGK